MHREACVGKTCASISEAMTAVPSCAREGCNTLLVRIPYNGKSVPDAGTKAEFGKLLDAAGNANLQVIPVLLDSKDITGEDATAATYAYNFVDAYYMDRRILAWCLYQQTSNDESGIRQALPYLFRKVRYAFANQPLFALPSSAVSLYTNTSGQSVSEIMWQLSDVCAVVNSITPLSSTGTTFSQQQRPTLAFSNTTFRMLSLAEQGIEERQAGTGRWDNWKAWQWMQREPVRGLVTSSVATALVKLNGMRGQATPYNTISVMLDYRSYASNPTTFFARTDSLLTLARELDMQVLPLLLSDSYINTASSQLTAYVKAVLTRYASNGRILAWDLYNKVNASSSNTSRSMDLVESLFEAARATKAQQPVFMTPAVSVTPQGNDFDAVQGLVHGQYHGWNYLSFGKGDVNVCYRIWCLSDVISFPATQTSPYVGWLTAIAGKFGRPLFCIDWKKSTSEDYCKVMDIFADMHVSWFVNGTIQDEDASKFRFVQIATPHIHQ